VGEGEGFSLRRIPGVKKTHASKVIWEKGEATRTASDNDDEDTQEKKSRGGGKRGIRRGRKLAGPRNGSVSTPAQRNGPGSTGLRPKKNNWGGDKLRKASASVCKSKRKAYPGGAKKVRSGFNDGELLPKSKERVTEIAE